MFFCLWIGTRTRKRVRKTAGFLWRKPSPLIVHQVHAFMQRIVHKRVFFFVFLYKYLVVFTFCTRFCQDLAHVLAHKILVLLLTKQAFSLPLIDIRRKGRYTLHSKRYCYDRRNDLSLAVQRRTLHNAYKTSYASRTKCGSAMQH